MGGEVIRFGGDLVPVTVPVEAFLPVTVGTLPPPSTTPTNSETVSGRRRTNAAARAGNDF